MRIKLVHNPRKSWTEKLMQDIEPFLETNNHNVVQREADATICIGGDGTILYANHQHRLQGAVLGIGTDTSYICQLYKDSWKEELLPILEKGKRISVMSLDADANGHHLNALNDFVVHTSDYRVMKMDVKSKGKSGSFYGDGIIFSSALGSPAYAYSAGGDEMEPTERKISVVPICPYRRAFSPIVLEEDEEVSVKVGNNCAFIIDGIFVRHLKKDETVHVKKGDDVEFFKGVGEYR